MAINIGIKRCSSFNFMPIGLFNLNLLNKYGTNIQKNIQLRVSNLYQ